MNTITITKYDSDNNIADTNYQIGIEAPKQCMHCLNTGVQIFMSGATTFGEYDHYGATCLYTCPLCESSTIHFFNIFETFIPGEFRSIEYLSPQKCIPTKSENPQEITSSIKEKFPLFIEIYEQAQKAEENHLDKMAGMGYRKSLEFLVTDFLLQYPIEGVTEDWLKNPQTSLSSKIKVLNNERIKKLATAISFIGNDETHYTRRHPEHDTESIKMFIKALLSDVENEMILCEAEALLNKPK